MSLVGDCRHCHPPSDAHRPPYLGDDKRVMDLGDVQQLEAVLFRSSSIKRSNSDGQASSGYAPLSNAVQLAP